MNALRRFYHFARDRDALLAALLLSFLLAVFFYRTLFLGRVFAPADLLFSQDRLWRTFARRPPYNPLLGDEIFGFIPFKFFLRQALRNGIFPLWNPYVNAGTPFIGNAQSAVFDVSNLIGLLFSLQTSLVITASLRLFLAGFFTYLFARELGLRFAGRTFAMVAFTFSSPIVVWVAYPLTAVSCLLPAALFAIERFFKRHDLRSTLLASLLFGIQFWGGQPENSFLLGLALAAYSLFRLFRTRLSSPELTSYYLTRLLLVAVLGVMIGAVQILPFLENLRESSIITERHYFSSHSFAEFFRRTLLSWQEWPSLITAFLPLFFGSPAKGNYWYLHSNYNEQNLYAGVLTVALAFAVVWSAIRSRNMAMRQHILFFASAAVICLGMAIRLPIFSALDMIPPLHVTASARLRFVYVFFLSLLAGIGLDQMAEGNICLKKRARVVSIALFLISLTLVGMLILDRTFFASLSLGIPRRFDFFLYSPLAILACFTAISWGMREKTFRSVWAPSVLILLALDLFLVEINYNPSIRPEQFYPRPAALRFLQEQSGIFRVGALGSMLSPNTATFYQLADVRGYEPMTLRRYTNIIRRIRDSSYQSHRSTLKSANSPLLALLNVKYMLTTGKLGKKWKLVFEGRHKVKVYENLRVLPRAFMVYRTEVVDDGRASLARIIDPQFKFRKTVVIEKSEELRTLPPINTETIPAEVTIRSYQPNAVQIDVKSEQSGMLVLTDSYMPGWRAYVDGTESQIFIAYHAFRAVKIPAGEHQIRFVYQPASFRIGALTTTVTLFFVFWFWFRERRSERTN